jgi:hypothetical protein
VEVGQRASIAGDVPLKLRPPVIDALSWDGGLSAARVLMPEATVDEDGLAVPRQDQVGRSGKVAAM